MKLHEVKLTRENLSAALTNELVKCNFNFLLLLINASRKLFFCVFDLYWAVHLGNRYSSLTYSSLFCIYEIRKFVHNYSRTAGYFERFSVVLGHFLKAPCAKHFLVAIASFLRKWASTLALGKKTEKKNHNSLFLRDQTQSTRNILKTLFHVFINGGFKLFFILSFIIAENLKGELLI